MTSIISIDVGAAPACDDTMVRETNGQLISQGTVDLESFVYAQRKAREWADRGIDLCQSGDTEGASDAERRAAVWLARMLEIEAGAVAAVPSPRLARLSARQAARTERRLNRSATSRNNVTLLAWRRSRLLPGVAASG